MSRTVSIPLFRAGVVALVLAAPAALASDGGDAQDTARYAAALRNAIQAQWLRPDTLPADASCRVRVRQLPGGDVLSAEVEPDCGFDPAGQRSLEAAVLRAQPLPYRGFERVFQRDLRITFRAVD